MKLWYSVLPLLIVAGAAGADRYKPDIDPESQDGILLQRILQEPTAPRKQTLLEKFVEQFPQATSIGWVYSQLLPIYLKSEEFDQALNTSEKLLALDATDLDAANGALRAAEGKKDSDLIVKYAELSWDAGSKIVQSPRPDAPKEAATWTKLTAFARDLMTYSEFALYTQSKDCPDPDKKTQLIQAIQIRNPQSKYLQSAKAEYFHTVEQGTPEEAVAVAEANLPKEPDNEEMLMVAAQYYFNKERDLERSFSYALRILEVFARKSAPENVSLEAWVEKKAKYTGVANWIAGIVYAKDGKYNASERHLRLSLPSVHENGMLAAAYFYLGYDNYALVNGADDKLHLQDALKYNKLCAALSSPFRELAQRNLEVIKNEFNVE